MKLLGIDTNSKTIKGQKKGYLTGIMYLAPADESGQMNVCANSSPACKADCLYTAGRGIFKNVKAARIKKTLLFKDNNSLFMEYLRRDIAGLVKKADKMNMIPCVRLNGTSDIPFENTGIMQEFPNIQFYDYTKDFKRMLKFLSAVAWPKNYYLTFSRSEINEAECNTILSMGGNVAVVFAKPAFPTSWNYNEVVNGDETDLRFLDKDNTIVGLKAKGFAKKDTTSGFVVLN